MDNKYFTINSAYQNVSSVCFIVKTYCEEHNVGSQKIKEVELSLAEALNNIIKHSYKGDESNKIDIALKIDTDKLIVDLTDYGETRKNLHKPVLEFDPNDVNSLPEGGMGLYIIEQLMDENNYFSDGNKNVFTLVKKIN